MRRSPEVQGLEIRVAMIERRIAPRFPLVLAAEIVDLSSRTKLQARTSDISRSGCYVDTLNSIPAGSRIHLQLTHENERFEVNAKVVYVSPTLGMGIAFDEDISTEQLAVLDRWLSESSQAIL